MNDDSGKKFWGPKLWSTIHCLAAAYTPDQKEYFKSFLNNLTKLLPCDVCREHFKKNLKQLDVNKYLDNKYQLFYWSYLLHDMVNKQLGKKSPDYNIVKDIYFKQMGESCTTCQS